MKESDKEAIRQIFNSEDYEVGFIENNEDTRNGLVRVNVFHEAQTLPNKWLKTMAENGYIVSCVCGGVGDLEHTTVYFEEFKGTF